MPATYPRPGYDLEPGKATTNCLGLGVEASPGPGSPRDVTKPYELVGFEAMNVTKPYTFIRFGAMDVTKPHEFIRFGAMDVIKPYEFVGGQVVSRPECRPIHVKERRPAFEIEAFTLCVN